MSTPLPGEGSALWETWQMLLNGYGYNWYRADHQARADEVIERLRALLRSQVARLLARDGSSRRRSARQSHSQTRFTRMSGASGVAVISA